MGKGSFHDHDCIERIDVYRAARIEMVHLLLLSELQPTGACGHAGKRIALTFCQQPMIGSISDCRFQRITSLQKKSSLVSTKRDLSEFFF